MTHEELKEISERVRIACEDAIYDTRCLLGEDVVFRDYLFKGRKGQITETFVDEGVMLVVLPYHALTKKLLSTNNNQVVEIEDIVLCNDKASYAKYLLTV